MKNPKTIKATAAVLALSLTLGVTVLAASYDSSEDPLISLSYLTNIFKPEIEKEYEDKVAALEARLTRLEGGTPANPDGDKSDVGETEPVIDTRPEGWETQSPETEPVIDTRPSSTYEVIELTYGDALYAVGACDIMLRSGSAVCIAPDAGQGIADYTDATEIYNEQALTKNHMLLIPRGDGRGVRATGESVYIMVRGDYTIVEG